jgi:hypothetical protein
MGPRLFGIPATEASSIAILRRGPSDWSHVGRWDPEAGTYEPGAWIHGRLYPQRCDVSPDGRWLVAFIYKDSWSWQAGPTYLAVSRLPWLTALAAWGTGSTWTRGLRFVPKGTAAFPPGPPDVGDVAPLLARYDVELRRAISFAVERDRGWTETADTPPLETRGAWDERDVERVTMEKSRPGDPATRLLVRGRFAAHRSMEPAVGGVRYLIAPAGADDGDAMSLRDVQWADWSRDGRLLVATMTGELEVRDDPGREDASWRHDLSSMTPSPQPAPAEASRW